MHLFKISTVVFVSVLITFTTPLIINAQAALELSQPDTLTHEQGQVDAMYLDYHEADSMLYVSDSLMLFQEAGDSFADDSPIVRMLDSLIRIRYFGQRFLTIDSAAYNRYGFDGSYVPTYPDSVYKARIAELNRETPIHLVYNQHVKSFIDLYSVRRRELTQRIYGLSHVYFPMFEEILDRYDIPLEMKYLAVIESALNPTAGSHMGARGLWQFMYGTGRVYNLRVTSLVDDRHDPYKSTVAAAEHMRDLYNIYQDWFLVLAAYNAGAGNVNRAIRRAGGVRDYWAIWPFLPRETRSYVPAFIAVNYVMNHTAEHNLYPLHPGVVMHGTDTVTVREVLSFDQLNEMLGIPMEDLKFFNPQFRRDIIPASTENPYIIRIPNEFIGPFLNNEQELYAYKTKKGIEKEKLLEQIQSVSDQSVHVVRSGENLGVIARRYRVSVNQLRAWNNLRSNTIYPGQRLTVFSSGTPVAQTGQVPVQRSSTATYHTVRQGETLGQIAQRYKCSITDLREWNSLSGSLIRVGQRLRVFPPEQATAQKAEVEGQFMIHTVKSGDTLWDIARAYDGVTVEQIKRLNNMGNNSRIRPGQKLRIARIG
jgi:membrane-bound lytic murein transglycosylase D